MTMLKKIKSLFLEEDEASAASAQTSAEEKVKTEPVQQTTTGAGDFSNLEAPENAGPANIDAKFIDILMKAIEQQNRQGFDYLEFKNSLQSLSKLDMDESTRFKSAFVMGKTMGLSKESLLDSIQHYIAVINQEESKFKETLQKQKSLQVQGKETLFKEVESAVSRKEKQIQQLQSEIEEEKQKLEGIREEIQKSIVKIDSTNDQFLAAHKLISKQMTDDIQKIKSYIES